MALELKFFLLSEERNHEKSTSELEAIGCSGYDVSSLTLLEKANLADVLNLSYSQ